MEEETEYEKKKKWQQKVARKKIDLRRAASLENDDLENKKMTQPMMPFANHDAIDTHKTVQKNALTGPSRDDKSNKYKSKEDNEFDPNSPKHITWQLPSG